MKRKENSLNKWQLQTVERRQFWKVFLTITFSLHFENDFILETKAIWPYSHWNRVILTRFKTSFFITLFSLTWRTVAGTFALLWIIWVVLDKSLSSRIVAPRLKLSKKIKEKMRIQHLTFTRMKLKKKDRRWKQRKKIKKS